MDENTGPETSPGSYLRLFNIVYLFYINNYLKKGDIPPRDFIYPTIKNIILNKRKLKFNKKFEKDILQDAIKSKFYEVY